MCFEKATDHIIIIDTKSIKSAKIGDQFTASSGFETKNGTIITIEDYQTPIWRVKFLENDLKNYGDEKSFMPFTPGMTVVLKVTLT